MPTTPLMLALSDNSLLSLTQIIFAIIICLSANLSCLPLQIAHLLWLGKQNKGAVAVEQKYIHILYTVGYSAAGLLASLLLPLSLPPAHTHKPTCDPGWDLASCCFLQAPGCRGNAAVSSQCQHLPSLTVCVHVHRKRQRTQENGGEMSGIGCGLSPFSHYEDGSFDTDTVLCVSSCATQFYPEALPQIPLHPCADFSNMERIQSLQLRQLVWKRISKAPNLSVSDSLPVAAAH